MTMNRREFLAVSSAFLAGGTLGCATLPLTGRDESVIVVGAGIAGLAAARNLQATGYTVTVLEASRRVGGRIYTNRDLGVPVELGASRIHGIKNNPIVPLLDQAGLGYLEVDWNSLSGIETDGTPMDNAELANVRDRLLGIFRRAFIRNLTVSEDFPIEHIIQREFRRREFSDRERRVLYFGIVSAEMMNASPFVEASWKYALAYEAFPGGDHFIVNGFDAVPELLATNLDVKMQVEVTRIDYGSSPVRVTTNSGTLSADRVVVTVPLGVLKAGLIEFSPALPLDKQRAIERIGMGLINKIALEFPKTFWPEHVHALAYGSDVRGEYPAFVNVARYTGASLLMAYVPSTYLNALEGMSDEDAIGGAVEVLRRMYGSSVPDPVNAVRTRWGAHPFTRGAFSFNKVGATTKDRDVLGKPVDERLFFAGEATSRKRFGSVSGAYLSGIRAAQDIMLIPATILA